MSEARGQESDRAAAARFDRAWEAFLLAIRRSQARGVQSEGLTLGQYYMLRALDEGGELNASELARESGVAAPTATRATDALEAAGLVRRRRPRGDRRSVRVSLTAKGREALSAKRRQLGRRRRRVHERLTPGEREHATALLQHLAELVGEL